MGNGRRGRVGGNWLAANYLAKGTIARGVTEQASSGALNAAA
jgi:hypothetical protein